MEFGIPGLKASKIAAEAEAQALLTDQVANVYAPFGGIPELKEAGSRFAKAFMNLDVDPSGVIPTNGAMQGCFHRPRAGRQSTQPERNTILYLDPGFPVNKIQTKVWGLEAVGLDLKDYRGKDLAEKVDELCRKHPIGACLWSSPNNPAWVVFV